MPNISFGPAMVATLRERYPNLPLDVHLMLSDPGKYLDVLSKLAPVSYHPFRNRD